MDTKLEQELLMKFNKKIGRIIGKYQTPNKPINIKQINLAQNIAFLEMIREHLCICKNKCHLLKLED